MRECRWCGTAETIGWSLAKPTRKNPEIVRVPRDRIVEAGGNPMVEPYYFGEYFDMPPITENVTKVRRVLRIRPTPFDQGLAETYRWLKPDFAF